MPETKKPPRVCPKCGHLTFANSCCGKKTTRPVGAA
jgi:rRNA maturation protein Nop10